MPASDFRKLDRDELVSKEAELREKVARLTMQRNARRLDRPTDLGKARRELARLLTVMDQQRRRATKEQTDE